MRLSVVIPVFNEAAVINTCYQRMVAVLDAIDGHTEMIFIDDGSCDDSWTRLQTLMAQSSSNRSDITVHCVRLSRNFGKEAALCAGLQASTGDAVVVLDADLQDPPELIPNMLRMWQQGFHVVEMQRSARLGERWWKRTSAAAFYRTLSLLSDIEISRDTGDFRLLDRRVVDVINRLPERTRFMKGLFAWPGFKRTALSYTRPPRAAGESKWPLSKLLHLALEGITSFSIKPLRLASFAGVLISLAAMGFMAFVLLKTLLFGNPVMGYPSLISVMLFLGGVQLLAIGILGEYVGRLFIEAKQRPLYLVMEEQKTRVRATAEQRQ